MPNSLRCKVKNLCHKGILNEKDRDRLIHGLDCADVLQEIRAEIDRQTEIHADGEFYIKNFDVKHIIDKNLMKYEE